MGGGRDALSPKGRDGAARNSVGLRGFAPEEGGTNEA